MKKLLLLPVFLFCFSLNVKSQAWGWQMFEVANMPIAISNNPVVEGWANDTGYVYSFGGIDATKIWSGINKKSFRYNTITDIWDTIPDLPNTNAVIAAGASYVDSVIYIMGGYQVLSNGNEISSNIVNRFDPRTNTYLSDGVNIPIAIDDHVQAVYKDSLIYLITGWSNTGNVPNVQIYDPANDNWLTGTPVPNNDTYKAFGASGTIIENTIYYHGGASTGFSFPGQSALRIGQIDPNDPTQIVWSTVTTNFITYRAASTHGVNGDPYWLGGSETTYNYNGVAYNGSGGVTPSQKALYLNTSNVMDTAYDVNQNMNLPMDLRGIGSFPQDGFFYLAGGMEQNQSVSNKTFRLVYTLNVSAVKENNISTSFQLYPNPTSEKINLIFKAKEKRTVTLLDLMGKEVFTTNTNTANLQLDVSNYPKGIYFIKVTTDTESSSQKIIVQ